MIRIEVTSQLSRNIEKCLTIGVDSFYFHFRENHVYITASVISTERIIEVKKFEYLTNELIGYNITVTPLAIIQCFRLGHLLFKLDLKNGVVALGFNENLEALQQNMYLRYCKFPYSQCTDDTLSYLRLYELGTKIKLPIQDIPFVDKLSKNFNGILFSADYFLFPSEGVFFFDTVHSDLTSDLNISRESYLYLKTFGFLKEPVVNYDNKLIFFKPDDGYIITKISLSRNEIDLMEVLSTPPLYTFKADFVEFLRSLDKFKINPKDTVPVTFHPSKRFYEIKINNVTMNRVFECLGESAPFVLNLNRLYQIKENFNFKASSDIRDIKVYEDILLIETKFVKIIIRSDLYDFSF